jgi:uncharacterized protein (TIGR02118 family)
MVKISILYPNLAGGRFDFDYYLSKHMPRSIELLGAHPGFRGVTVERGVGGAEPGAPPKYLAACFYTFDSLDSFFAAFMPCALELQGDMSNYTDVPAEIQFNEILIEKPGAAHSGPGPR